MATKSTGRNRLPRRQLDPARMGKVAPGTNRSWDGIWRNAESERVVVVRAFWEWAENQRIKLTSDLMHSRAIQAELEPFARLGVEKAANPRDLPLVVVEYVTTIFEGNDLDKKVMLLNSACTHHRQLYDECFLDINMAPAIKELWEWFMDEHTEGANEQA